MIAPELADVRVLVLPLAEAVAARSKALGLTVECEAWGADEYGVPVFVRADSAGAVTAFAREEDGTVRAEWHVAGEPRRRKLGDRHLDMKRAPRHVLQGVLRGLEHLIRMLADENQRRQEEAAATAKLAGELRAKLGLNS